MSPIYVLAADHRWQLEEWCDANAVQRSRIAEIKALVFDGFRRARSRHASAAAHGALLIDEQYAAPLIEQARREGIAVATPAEKAGVFPLEWATERFEDVLTGGIAKVLVRYRPEYSEARVAAERAKIKALAVWCAERQRPLLLEVVVVREHEAEAAFETDGRPAIAVDYIERAYADDLVPDFWKMEGTISADAAAAVDRAVAGKPGPRFLVLGKGAGLELVEQWIAVAKRMRTAAGFAIGRTVYWSACTAWVSGALSRDAAVEQVASNYERLIDAWQA